MRLAYLFFLLTYSSQLMTISGKAKEKKEDSTGISKHLAMNDYTLEKCLKEKRRKMNCTIGSEPNSVKITEFEEMGICIYDFEELTEYSTAVYKCKRYGLLPLIVKTETISRDLEDAFPSHKPVWLGARRTQLPHWTYVVTGVMIAHIDENVMDTKALRCGAIRWNVERQQLLTISMPCWGRDTTETRFLCRPIKPCNIMTHKGLQKCLFYDLENSARVSWFEARNYCHKHEGDLFFLRSGENWKMVMFYMVRYWDSPKEIEDIFVGLQIQKWIWDDETDVVYSKWSVSDSVKHDCARLFHSEELLWQSSSCIEKAAVYCISDLTKDEERICEAEVKYTRQYIEHIVMAIVFIHIMIFALVWWSRTRRRKRRELAAQGEHGEERHALVN